MGATFTIPLWEVLDITDDIGLGDYPIFDEDYRAILNRKIIRHFWNEEIGQETISMFRLALSRFMDENMSYYNEQYRLGLIAVDPLLTVKIKSLSTTTGQATSASGVTANTTSDSRSRGVASDYPQQSLQPGSDYASSSQDNIGDTRGESISAENRDDTNTGSAENTQEGYSGHAPSLIRATREALINVDVMLIEEIKRAGLFMLIYSIPDTFTNRGISYYGY